MDIKSTINTYKGKVDSKLELFFEEHQASAYAFDQSTKEAYTILKDFTLGSGKRLRPILMILGYKACGGTDENAIIEASCSIEFMQSYLLIHDDVMDLSLLRRGKPTLHKMYENEYQNKKTSAHHFGISMAILVGDLANHLGLIAISESKFNPSFVTKALEEYNRIAVDVCYGQILDMNLPLRDVVSYEDVAKVHEAKTSRYSTVGPLVIGALLAGADLGRIASLTQYANPLGQAFQIKDDLLGMYGSEERIEKSVYSDLREGKKTLLILRALENGNESQRNIITQNLGNENVTVSDLEAVRRVVDVTGAKKYSEERMAVLTEAAKRAIMDARLDTYLKDTFISLADYLLNREK
jgi:geranylgeranyl diphosphate synthase type I